MMQNTDLVFSAVFLQSQPWPQDAQTSCKCNVHTWSTTKCPFSNCFYISEWQSSSGSEGPGCPSTLQCNHPSATTAWGRVGLVSRDCCSSLALGCSSYGCSERNQSIHHPLLRGKSLPGFLNRSTTPAGWWEQPFPRAYPYTRAADCFIDYILSCLFPSFPIFTCWHHNLYLQVLRDISINQSVKMSRERDIWTEMLATYRNKSRKLAASQKKGHNHFQLGNEWATLSWEFEVSICFLAAVQMHINRKKVHRCESSFNPHQWLPHHPFHKRLTKPHPSGKCICFPLRKGQRGPSLPVLLRSAGTIHHPSPALPAAHCLSATPWVVLTGPAHPNTVVISLSITHILCSYTGWPHLSQIPTVFHSDIIFTPKSNQPEPGLSTNNLLPKTTEGDPRGRMASQVTWMCLCLAPSSCSYFPCI